MGILSKFQRGHESRDKKRRDAEQAKKEAKERAELKKQLRKEADGYAQIIIKTSWNREYRQILRGALSPTIIDWWMGQNQFRTLKFTHACFDEYRIWLRINARELPGISHYDLKEESFLYDLSRSVNKEIEYEGSAYSGDFIIINRDSSISGIPDYLSFKKALAWVEEAEGDPLAFCMGQAANSQPLIVSLLSLPHLLVSGTTRYGKSVQLNNILSTYVQRNSPDIVKLVLIDFKSGLEFGPYEGLPHLFETPGTEVQGIAITPDEAKLAMNAILAEMTRRGALFKAHHVRNIEEYHKTQQDNKIPWLVVAIDEISLMMFHPDKEISKTGKELLNTLVAAGAAYGIHVIGCTQDPTREVLPRIIKNNFTGRCVFRARSIPSSVAVLENKHAYDLKGKGRGIFQLDDEIQFQGPWISTDTVKHVVRTVTEYYLRNPNGKKSTEIGLTELLIYALENRATKRAGEYSLAWEPLAEVFAPQGLSAVKIKTLLPEADNRLFEIDGKVYQVRNNAGRTGRVLVFVRPIEVGEDNEINNSMAAD